MNLEEYEYYLPPELIRKKPLERRDESRLFVYDTQNERIHFDVFKNIQKYLPKDTILVRNITKVLPVRLHLYKETGGKIEVFVLMNEYKGGDSIPAIVDRKLVVGNRVYIHETLWFKVVGQDEGTFYLKPNFEINTLESILSEYGTTPIPHYLEEGESDEHFLRVRYQSMFAEKGASTAAPTASLHFTQKVFESLQEKDIATCDVLLNVGLGTFKTIDEKNFKTQKLHKEYFEVSNATAKELYKAKQYGKNVVAVGTTAMRSLESWKHTEEFKEEQGASGDTEIFIYPPYEDFFADGLITNFHLPKSSLMLLVEAFLQNKNAKKSLVELYEIAIKEKFSFYSFGDAMLIL